MCVSAHTFEQVYTQIHFYSSPRLFYVFIVLGLSELVIQIWIEQRSSHYWLSYSDGILQHYAFTVSVFNKNLCAVFFSCVFQEGKKRILFFLLHSTHNMSAHRMQRRNVFLFTWCVCQMSAVQLILNNLCFRWNFSCCCCCSG